MNKRGRPAQEVRLSEAEVAQLRMTIGRAAKSYPTGAVHVVWDNLNTHRAEKKVWAPFNQRHGNRFHFHFTPLHASWVNQVELWFGIYSRRVLRRASFSSIAQLKEKSKAFCQEWNEKGKPFDWTFRGYHLQTGERLEG